MRLRISWKTFIMAALTALAVTVIFGSSACSRGREDGNYTKVDDNDPAMNAAIAKAKATINDFVQAFHAEAPGTSEFFVKKPYKTVGNGEEHMWIAVEGEKDGVIHGTISNDAEETKEVKMGDKVTLKLSEISDWKYQQGKKLVGGFTIRYFLDKMTPKEREAFLKQEGFEL